MFADLIHEHFEEATIQRTISFFRMVIHHKTKLHEESLNRNISFGNFEEYCARVKKDY